MAPVRFAALLLSLGIGLRGESAVNYDCPSEDIEQFGLTCSEDEPCTVLLELRRPMLRATGSWLPESSHSRRDAAQFVAGERRRRGYVDRAVDPDAQRGAGADRVLGRPTGWVSGESINPLARNRFCC